MLVITISAPTFHFSMTSSGTITAESPSISYSFRKVGVDAGIPLTEERVRKGTVTELKAVAHGPLPAGRSTFRRQDWLDHVLKLLGFVD